MVIYNASASLFQKPAVCDRYVNHRDSEQWNHVEKEKEKGEDRDKNEWEHDDSLGHKRKSARRGDSANDQVHRGRKDAESIVCNLNITCI